MESKTLCVGLVCLDIVAEIETFPLEDTDQRIPGIDFKRGGNASNSSSVLGQLGMPTEFLGALYSSNLMELEYIKKDFASFSVSFKNCPILSTSNFPTSVVLLNSSNGSRTILHHSKNVVEITYQYFSESVDVSKYSWIHFEGRSGNVENIKKMIELVRRRSIALVSVEIEKPRRILQELFPFGDVVFVSKEYAQLSGFHSMKEAVKGFIDLAKPEAVVVCAWGSEGAAAGKKDTFIIQSAFPPEKVTDTLGAGDTFNAAYIYSYQASCGDWKNALEFACRVAGYKTGQKGFHGLDQFQLPGFVKATINEDQR